MVLSGYAKVKNTSWQFRANGVEADQWEPRKIYEISSIHLQRVRVDAFIKWVTGFG
jgi:hypothetical protein